LRSGGKPIGVILGGQTLLSSPVLEKYKALARRCGIGEEEMMKSVGELSLGTERMLRNAAEFITETGEVVFSGWHTQSRVARKLSLLTSLYKISTGLSPKMDIHEIYALILNSLAILFDVDSASLLLPDPVSGDWISRTAFGPQAGDLMSLRLSKKEPILEQLYSSGESFSTDDYYLLLRSGLPESIRQLTLFPLFAGEELQGILSIFNHPLEDEERNTIAHFANYAANTIQSAALREQLTSKISSMTTMTNLSMRFCNALEMDELLEVIFEEAVKLARAERSSLMLLNEQSRELNIKLVRGSRGDVLKNCSIPLEEGLSGQVAKLGEPLLVKNLEEDSRIHRQNRSGYKTPSFVILPLKAGDRTIGVLNITDKNTGGVYTEDDLEMLRSLTTQAAVALERSELYLRSKELKRISITDPLTGLLNRRYFQERSLEEIDRSRRHGQPLSMIMIDVDDFKFYNDRHGHLAGDAVLKNTGNIVKSMVRNIDVVSRFGGEEFAVLSPNTGKEMALQIAERIRAGIADHMFPGEGEQPGEDLTISVGTATFPEDAAHLDELINNADKALYLSKKSGKNKATAYKPAT
jgi:diguanylate cyclase (GGDEF)-like protein